MTTPGTIAWFTRHEMRLAWREWLGMMTAGRRWRARSVVIGLVVFGAVLHLIAYSMVGRYADVAADLDTETLVVITGSGVLALALMLSQAMESVTRAFYTRSDLDLILSSPANSRKLFVVRLGAIAVSVAGMATLLASPFINVLVLCGGPRWLAAYGVVAAMSAASAALAIALTVGLFRAIGPRRTRLVAQVVAAVIGAAFVIGLQIAAIQSAGTLSRFTFLQSSTMLAIAPDHGSMVWWPARAMLGDPGAFVAVVALCVALLGTAITVFSAHFGDHAAAAAGISHTVTRQRRRQSFRRISPMWALRHKEWTLLRRDPWLMSQTLMQILYLIPPALLLWKSYGDGPSALTILVPVLVMAAGQLAGGLAWLAISGEDAPDLVTTAPVRQTHIMRAKVEAVVGAVGVAFAPFILALGFISPSHAAISLVGILLATFSATSIQLWFRAQAKRSQFRRRQTSSRVATFAEAFSSITWAGAAALAAAGTWLFALIVALIAVGLLAGTRMISPRGGPERLAWRSANA